MPGFTTPDGFIYETTKDQPGVSLRAPDEILAEQVQDKFADTDAEISDLTSRLDNHEAVYGTAGDSSDLNLQDTPRTFVSTPVTVPSHWNTWTAEIHGTLAVVNEGTGGGSPSSDRRMNVFCDDSSSNIGFVWQYTVEASKDNDLISIVSTNPSGSAASGTITFRLRASLTTNDSYHVTLATIAVTLHRLT